MAAPETKFTRDVIGRNVCNDLNEALTSTQTTTHPNARPFDLIVIGGGSFGAVLASHLFSLDKTRSHRILVLEGGPMLLPEHVQNLPPGLAGLGDVSGVPWVSDSPQPWNRQFPGLAYCIGGRSLFWGGWSPYFIDSELPAAFWPDSVIKDLNTPVLPKNSPKISYLDQAADQIGVTATNDFVFGKLHTALRDRLFSKLPTLSIASTTLTGNRGTLNTVNDLEAPLAVESASSRPGFFPFNKFNGTQLLIRSVRIAQSEAEQTVPRESLDSVKDVMKRLMVVNNTHVIRLERDGNRIAKIVTNQGTVTVPPNGKVFLALGTIENTRLALNTMPENNLIGRNLMAHLRSNLTIRIPNTSLGLTGDLETSALFVKGIHQHIDGSLGHFHVQITASGTGALNKDSEAELFKKIPDLDTLDQLKLADDKWAVITLRGIGEMIGDKTSADPQNRITRDAPKDSLDYGENSAKVRLESNLKDINDPRRVKDNPDLTQDSKDNILWKAMDRACDELATLFANGEPIEYLSLPNAAAKAVWQKTSPESSARQDSLSSTHHEGGTLWMGSSASNSVTDELGKFWTMDNLYAIGPAILPTLGSPNPMLSGVALTRRTADRLLTASPSSPEAGFEFLFDGTDKTFTAWQMAGEGAFSLIDGVLVAQPSGKGLGLLYYAPRPFGNYVLRLQFRLDRVDDNSGIFLRFRDPRRPVPDRNDPSKTFPYDNQAWVGVTTGFEVQIDETARPNNWDKNRTGAIYDIPTGQFINGAQEPKTQDFQRSPDLQVGQWNEYEIEVVDNRYKVSLNGQAITKFQNSDSFRGKSPSIEPFSGYIGLQVETGRVAFRNIRIKTL
jgi:choline dehydrogenase-like flavoprotein